MFARCDKTVPHGSHPHDEQVTVGNHTQKMRVKCPGITWPTPNPRCLSVYLTDGQGFERDLLFRCAREAGHLVDSAQGEYHSTRNFEVMWSDRLGLAVHTWAVAILIEAPTDQEATRLASELAAAHDQAIFDFYPVVYDVRVKE